MEQFADVMREIMTLTVFRKHSEKLLLEKL